MDFSNLSLKGAIFSGAKMVNSIFQNTDLRNAVLKGAILKNANLKGADLQATLFSQNISTYFFGYCGSPLARYIIKPNEPVPSVPEPCLSIP